MQAAQMDRREWQHATVYLNWSRSCLLYTSISLITSAGFLGLILYFILAVIIPEDDGIVD